MAVLLLEIIFSGVHGQLLLFSDLFRSLFFAVVSWICSGVNKAEVNEVAVDLVNKTGTTWRSPKLFAPPASEALNSTCS